MFFNWFFESYKWQLIASKFEKITILQSTKSVLFGLSAAVFTPYRLGEFIGRPMMFSKDKRIQATLATFIGSIAQNAVTVCMAAIGILFFILAHHVEIPIIDNNIYPVISIILISCLLILFLFFNPKYIIQIANKINYLKKWHEKFRFILNYNWRELLYILVISNLRYIIFFFQYFLLLKAFNVNLQLIDAFCAISLSYVILFSIPGLPIAEPGMRGSIALFLLGAYSGNDIGILLASTSLWIVNLALPCILGSFLIYKNKHSNGQKQIFNYKLQ
jgi:hypothetical protein